MVLGLFLIPRPVAAYIIEDAVYTADGYIYEGGEDPVTYWLHTEATIRYKYSFIGGRLRLISVEWYKVEHTFKAQNPGYPWISCYSMAEMFILRNYQELWYSGRYWISHLVRYPGISAQTGDQLRDSAFSGGLPGGGVTNWITITV